MGIGWNPQGGFWYFSENVNTAMRFVRNNAGYTGYGGTDTLMTEFPDGILMGGENQGNNKDRQFEMSPLKPVSNAHAAGDVAIFTNAVPGGASEWVDVPVFSTTLTAPVAVGATTAAVAACPTATIPASLFLSDMGASAAGSPDTLGTYVSCTSLTMTISAALHAGATGDTVKILQWTTGAELSNDPNLADYSFTVLRSGSSANKDLTGRIALAGGAATYTLSGIYASPPDCITADVTTPANANSVLESITTLTFTGTGTDTLKWVCAGRN
jgi:hypothetical protein